MVAVAGELAARPHEGATQSGITGKELKCLVCGTNGIREFLDLGEMPLANRFRRPGASGAEPRYPLRAGWCPRCKHVQLMERVKPEEMYEEYLYISSCSRTLVSHLEELARAIAARVAPAESDLAIDIGSNDGTLLEAVARTGMRVLGVDPAKNLAPRALARGVRTVTDYFGAEVARRIVQAYGPARVISATNSFPHIPDLDDYMEGVSTLLAPSGYFVIEAHYLADVVEQVAFDTIYHEHVSYWSLGPLAELFNRHGLEIVDAERLPIHHGQIRVWARRRGQEPQSAAAAELIRKEADLGLDRMETYCQFADATRRVSRDLAGLLKGLREEGRRVAGYGAPAKASTLAGAAGIDRELLPAIADRSPLKQGLLLPGTSIPIVSPEEMLDGKPEYVVILAWNFAEEIMTELSSFRSGGGKFIIPVPAVRVI